MTDGTKTALVIGGLLVSGGAGYGIYKLLSKPKVADEKVAGLTYYGDHNAQVAANYWNQQRGFGRERRILR